MKSIAITQEMINEAADNYALKELGQRQFKSNPDAVEAITETFKEGCKYLLEVVSGNGEIINLT